MPKLISQPFFAANAVFTRAEYAEAVGRTSTDAVVSSMLAHHLRAGNISRVARGVYASVPPHLSAATYRADPFLAATRLRKDAVIAYHGALNLHGCCYSITTRMQAISKGKPATVYGRDIYCQFVHPPRGFNPSDSIVTFTRYGLEVRCTTIERTIVDVVDRYHFTGGADEIFNSLDFVPRVDFSALLTHVRTLGKAVVAGVIGYWLERYQEDLRVPDHVLQELDAMKPSQARYAMGTKPGYGKLAKTWNVYLPFEIVEELINGMDPRAFL